MSIGTIEALRESEFFTFFSIHEVSRRESDRPGINIMQCKPGGFQESIDLSFDVNARGDVFSARLTLDRSWIGGGEHVNPFSNDIVKSFIDVLVPPADHVSIEPLLSAIMDAKGVDDTRMYLHDQPRDLTPDFNTIKALGVYLGVISKHEIVLASSKVRMENAMEGKRERFTIDIASNRGPV